MEASVDFDEGGKMTELQFGMTLYLSIVLQEYFVKFTSIFKILTTINVQF
jgi:hypothetical protein